MYNVLIVYWLYSNMSYTCREFQCVAVHVSCAQVTSATTKGWKDMSGLFVEPNYEEIAGGASESSSLSQASAKSTRYDTYRNILHLELHWCSSVY